jgi:hypothetical protein
MVEANMPPSGTQNAGFTIPKRQSVRSLDEVTVFDMTLGRGKPLSREASNEDLSTTHDEPLYPGRLLLAFILMALLMAMFLVQEHGVILCLN